MDKVYGVKIKANGEVGIVEMDAYESEPTLESLQREVGGYIEYMKVNANFCGFCGLYMVGDEDAKLKSKTLNILATFLYNAGYPKVYDWIVGDVVIVETSMNGDTECWDRDTAEYLLEQIMNYFP